MPPSRLPRQVFQQTNSGTYLLPFLYNTNTIIRGYAGSSHGAQARSQQTTVNIEANVSAKSQPRKAQTSRQDGYDGGVAHSYARGAASRHRAENSQERAPTEKRRSTPQKEYAGPGIPSYARGAAKQYRAESTPKETPTEEPRTRPRRRMSKNDQEQKKFAVPFEEGAVTAGTGDRPGASTMTWSELKRFEKLFKMGASAPAKSTKKSAEGDSTGAEKPARSRAQHHPKPEFPDLLRPLAEEAAQLRASNSIRSVDQQITLDEKSAAYLTDVKNTMNQAKTDVKLWQVLQKHVFEKIAALELRDSTIDAKQQAAVTEDKLKDFHLLSETLSETLLHFMSVIQSSFPGSHLGLVLIPELKRLGPSAFALAATTDLYNHHIQLLFKHYTDLDGICETLSEMDKEVYEFNIRTQTQLDAILRHANAAKQGRRGSGLQAFWLTDRRGRALVKLAKWKEKVDEQVTATAMREAREKAAEVEASRSQEFAYGNA